MNSPRLIYSKQFREGTVKVDENSMNLISNFYNDNILFFKEYTTLVTTFSSSFKNTTIFNAAWQRAFLRIYRDTNKKDYDQLKKKILENYSSARNFNSTQDILGYFASILTKNSNLYTTVKSLLR